MCALMMDILVLMVFAIFALKGTTWRIVIAIASFQVIKYLCAVRFLLISYAFQKMFLMRIPENYLWEYPGFPSMSVSYGKRNDFFISGHVCMCLLAFYEFNALNFCTLGTYSLLTLTFQVFLIISVRRNYFIDLVIAFVLAHYLWILSETYSHHIDVRFFKIPQAKRGHIMTHSCMKCQEPLPIKCDLN